MALEIDPSGKKICSRLLPSPNECDSHIFESREEMHNNLTRFCYGNFYVMGRIWVEAVKTVLTGSKMCLVPTVEAAPKQKEPTKPPKMGYQDLCMYDDPHARYAEHLYDKQTKCPGGCQKLLHEYIRPTVCKKRAEYQAMYNDIAKFFKELYAEVIPDLIKSKNDFKAYMRCDKNLNVRLVALIVPPVLAHCIAGRKGLRMHTRNGWFLVTTLFTGWLCFPQQTDEVVRTISPLLLDIVMAGYGLYAGIDASFKDPVCVNQAPKEPPKRNVDKKYQCPAPRK